MEEKIEFLISLQSKYMKDDRRSFNKTVMITERQFANLIHSILNFLEEEKK